MKHLVTVFALTAVLAVFVALWEIWWPLALLWLGLVSYGMATAAVSLMERKEQQRRNQNQHEHERTD